MDWVQLFTIVFGFLILASTIKIAVEKPDKEAWAYVAFTVAVFIPFARVLGLL